jgi:AAA15 family ATPase/GTPase
MIKKLVLKNFKSIKDETYEFENFDLIVGGNNSGKSTILQALAIWQYCVDQFKAAEERKGNRGVQVTLPNFTALPLPEFALLWTDKSTKGKDKNAKPKNNTQKNIYIEINVYWYDEGNKEKNFCVQLYYQSPQTIYANPESGWDNFRKLSVSQYFPKVVYVPTFSGLEPYEKWMDEGNIRQQVGKAQPGSVLRNLLYRATEDTNNDWKEIQERVQEWFDIDIQKPDYTKGKSTEIKVEYKRAKKSFDIISEGSGFHQILTLLASIYGYKNVTTILLDEPDAHLHVNLQKKIVKYFVRRAEDKQLQFLIATHSEEFIKNVETSSILSVLSGKPKRINEKQNAVFALAELENNDIVRVRTSKFPLVLYLEGEDDERILSAWAKNLEIKWYNDFTCSFLKGGNKSVMKDTAKDHCKALKQYIPNVKKIVLLDRDKDEEPQTKGEPWYNEWNRKHIESYLLVPEVWKRAVAYKLKEEYGNAELFIGQYNDTIDHFFSSENIMLPPAKTWKNVDAKLFKTLDAKTMLFESENSLRKKILDLDTRLKINRTDIASAMKEEEMHEDIINFFNKMEDVYNKVKHETQQ